jgi:putative peptidoglycan lipid II flippase
VTIDDPMFQVDAAVPAAAPTFLKASAQVSVITALARVAGFARWIVLGVAVGTTYLGNTYQTANWVPNIVFDLAAGGVLSAVFVPTFVRELAHGRERGVEVASGLANTFLLASAPLVIAAVALAHPIMRALTAGVADPSVRAREVAQGAWFLYFFAPQIPLYVLAMVMTGILHAHRRFGIPALAPLLSSLVVIASYLAFGKLGAGAELGTVTHAQLWILAGGTTLGVIVLAFSQLPSVVRLGFRWRPILGWSDAAVRGAIKAGTYGMAYFAVTTAGLLVTLELANRVRGGVVAYRVAYAFFELPKALIGLPVAIAMLPALSERFNSRDEDAFGRLVSRGWTAAAFAAAPASAGLFVLAPVISAAMLGHAHTGAAPELVASTLRGLALGIPAFVLVEPLARSFYARRDTRTPVLWNAFGLVAFVATVLPVTIAMHEHGARVLEAIGGANAVGTWVAVTAGVVMLALVVPAWPVRTDVASAIGSFARAAVMGGAVWVVAHVLAQRPVAASVAGIAAGAAVYAALSARSGQLGRTVSLLRDASI